MRFPSAGLIGLALAICSAGLAQAAPDEELRKLVDEEYAHRDLHPVDWDARFATFAPRLRAATDPVQFAKLAAQLLEPTEDTHISVAAGTRSFPAFVVMRPITFDARLVAKEIPDAKSDHRCVSHGHAGSGVGYLVIGAWTPPCAASAKRALDSLAGSPALVIDVRRNSGGDDRLAQEIAGRFVDKPTLYAYVERITAGRFAAREPRSFAPQPSSLRFRGPVTVLIGPGCMSSCESFALMMRAAGATLMGQRSFGSSGNPLPHRLSNGVTVKLPSWRELMRDGTPLESKGIEPDLDIPWPKDPTEDRVLSAALKLAAP